MERRRTQHQNHAWQEENIENERSWQDDPEEFEPRREQVEEIMATNRTVMLTCTLAAMLPPFALFLLYAEKRSRAIRHFAVQSAALTAMHLAVAAALVLVNAVLGSIPFLGFVINLAAWIVYIAAAIVLLILRVRMMTFAWRGVKFTLPLIGHRLNRFN